MISLTCYWSYKPSVLFHNFLNFSFNKYTMHWHLETRLCRLSKFLPSKYVYQFFVSTMPKIISFRLCPLAMCFLSSIKMIFWNIQIQNYITKWRRFFRGKLFTRARSADAIKPNNIFSELWPQPRCPVVIWCDWWHKHNYRTISNIRCPKSPNLNVSRLVVELSLPNPMKPVVKSRMKM